MKAKFIYLGLLGLLMSVVAFTTQNHPIVEELQSQLEKWQKEESHENVYLQFDRTLYKPGEDIWFKAYVRDASTFLAAESEIIYVEMLDPRGSKINEIKLICRDGQAAGDFKLSENCAGGIYKIKAYTQWQKNQGEEAFFTKELTVQKAVLPRLLMELEYMSKSYGPGAKVEARFKASTPDKKALANTEVQYVFSLDGNTRTSGKVKTDVNGLAFVRFDLPENLETNDGLLNLLAPYQGANESISRSVPIMLGNLDLQFLPEGGDLLNNITGRVAFKALDEMGNPADIEGYITERSLVEPSDKGPQSGNKILEFKSLHNGIGSFEFTPKANKNYVAVITEPRLRTAHYNLPDVAQRGYALKATQQANNQNVSIDVLTTEAEEVQVVLKARNGKLVAKTVQTKPGANNVVLEANDLPIGIASVTVFDSKKKPRTERLVFVGADKKLNVKVKTHKDKYLPREKVDMTIEVTDEKGLPVSGNFSLAVADDQNLTFADDKQGNLLSQMLLQQDLKGEIVEPNFYFDNETDMKRMKPEVPRAIALDNLMLTHGWRRFEWEAVQKAKYTDKKTAKESARISGTVKNEAGQTIGNASVEATVGTRTYREITDNEGKFSMKVNEFDKPVTVKVVAGSLPASYTDFEDFGHKEIVLYKERIVKGNVKDASTGEPVPFCTVKATNDLQQLGTTTDADGNFTIKVSSKVQKLTFNYIGYEMKVMEIPQKPTMEVVLAQQQNQLLEAVVVNGGGRRPNRAMAAPGAVRKDVAKKSKGAKRAPQEVNVQEDADFGAAVLNIAIPQPAMAMPAPPPPPPAPAIQREKIMAEEAEKGQAINDEFEWEEKEVMAQKPAAKQLAADDFMNKEMMDKKRIDPKVVSPVRKYYTPRNYQSPTYIGASANPDTRSDFRQTIYWNPNVTTGRNGKATVSFYASDAITQFKATVEGFGDDGSIGRGEGTIFTQLPFALDAKVPSQVLTNDVLDLPIVLTNNTDAPLDGILEITPPANFSMDKASLRQKVNIAPRSVQRVPVRATVLNQLLNGIFVVRFSAHKLDDQVSIEVQTKPRGFPVEVVRNGDELSETHQITISNPVEGSVRATVQLFPSSLGEAMGAMRSSLRQPNGCFEQTSSSNYPNIYALQYLRETNQSDPTLEATAMGYLKNGYERLKGYQSPGGGFDWWGRAPAHEALSALGILQFTEMATILPDVDPSLVKNAVAFLEKRKNGNGGFTLNPNALHSWATSDVTNAFIVYALCEAKKHGEFKKEVEQSANVAEKSNELYIKALMANALFAKGDKELAEKLVADMVSKQSKDGSFAGPGMTVVMSSGVTYALETTSLAVVAMARSKKYAKEMNKAVEFIQSQKGFNGYGSTMSNGLAIKALLEHAKTSKVSAEPGVFAVYVNGKKAASIAYEAGQKEIVLPDFGSFLGTGDNKVETRFEGAKTPIRQELTLTYNTSVPPSAADCAVSISSQLASANAKAGETLRLTSTVSNKSKDKGQPMTLMVVGIPAGLSLQPWQLKELQEKKAYDYYELFDGYAVFHFEQLKPNEARTVNLDLKADVPGKYESPASSAYLYYTNNLKSWAKPVSVAIQ